jgi:hypothetical protein
LAVRKETGLAPRDKDCSDDLPIADHWHAQAGTIPTYARSVLGLIKSIGEDVRDMTDISRSYCTRYNCLGIPTPSSVAALIETRRI